MKNRDYINYVNSFDPESYFTILEENGNPLVSLVNEGRELETMMFRLSSSDERYPALFARQEEWNEKIDKLRGTKDFADYEKAVEAYGNAFMLKSLVAWYKPRIFKPNINLESVCQDFIDGNITFEEAKSIVSGMTQEKTLK